MQLTKHENQDEPQNSKGTIPLHFLCTLVSFKFTYFTLKHGMNGTKFCTLLYFSAKHWGKLLLS